MCVCVSDSHNQPPQNFRKEKEEEKTQFKTYINC